PPSPMSNATNSAEWSTIPSDGSNRRSSCRTAASGVRTTPVPVARTSASVWDSRHWSKQHSFGVQETILVCLTNLRTNHPPMLPKLNKKRALFVLTKVDEILAWEQGREAERDTRFVELGRYLCEVRAGQYWRIENLKSFDEFLEQRFPESRRKAYYLMSIHEHLPKQIKKDLPEIGWAKAVELVKIARADRDRFDCDRWLRNAQAMPKEQFRHEVEKHLTGEDSEPSDIVYFKLYKSQIPVVEEAIEA